VRLQRAVLLAGLLAGACRPPAPPTETPTPPAPGYPGTLVDPAGVPRDFLMRQHIRGAWKELRFSFEAVVQKRGDALTVLGLTPFGAKAFTLVQVGTDVRFTLDLPHDMPFPPEYILRDVHRAFLWDVELPWGTRGKDGDNVATVAGERVAEAWRDGALVTRSFAAISGSPAGTIAVTYGDGMRDGVPAGMVVLDNGWFGYRLEIEIVEWRPL
jgi:hypothetical protein